MAQPLVYDGVIYIVTGQMMCSPSPWKPAGDLEYRSAEGRRRVRLLPVGQPGRWTGRWQGIRRPLDACCGADQRTGKVMWQTKTGEPKLGYSLTAAPLYYNGRVIIGTAGGDLGIRGWIRSFDAKTGKEVWRFDTIPGPGEFGHDSWPANSDVWQWGGAPVWSTPAIDPELGLLYFSTGNPGPSLGGAVRPGNDLFTDSIVAVDVSTGKYRWHFQEVHHDIWDYDAPNPIILFEAEYGGKLRKGLAQAGKTGWVYILDRTTGKPLIGINETPVAQEPAATSPTQPCLWAMRWWQYIGVRRRTSSSTGRIFRLHRRRGSCTVRRSTGRPARTIRAQAGCTSAPTRARMARAWMARSSHPPPSRNHSVAVATQALARRAAASIPHWTSRPTAWSGRSVSTMAAAAVRW
jgi:hypothetical protein